jgi:uncharacterized protein
MIKTLLLSGENNHDWRRSSPFVRDLLVGSGKFEVTVAEDPSSVLEDIEGLAKYALIFSDYNGPEWSELAQRNFEAAVRSGTGLLVLHAADNAFTGWVEYEKMVAMLWREGTSHGEFHEFPVTYVDRRHPVTQGLEDFRLWDELYHKLVHMHGAEYHVLATAYSATERGGTGNDEPVMMTMQYGAGRVFHMVLGHVWEGDPNGEYKGASMITFENPGFQTALVRACEWAATGDVTG